MKFRYKIIMIFSFAILCCFAWQIKDKKAVFVMSKIDDKVILLDAGHGGWDPGKVSADGIEEKEVNLEIAKHLQKYLETSGATVLLTRNEDEALGENKKADLNERIAIAREGVVDIIISIHQNSFTQEKIKGAQVFYFKGSPEGESLAKCIQNRLKSTVDENNNRQVKANEEYFILKNDDATTVLVECGFLSNATEKELLNDEKYRRKISWAIYLGIIDYFNSI